MCIACFFSISDFWLLSLLCAAWHGWLWLLQRKAKSRTWDASETCSGASDGITTIAGWPQKLIVAKWIYGSFTNCNQAVMFIYFVVTCFFGKLNKTTTVFSTKRIYLTDANCFLSLLKMWAAYKYPFIVTWWKMIGILIVRKIQPEKPNVQPSAVIFLAEKFNSYFARHVHKERDSV